MKQHQELITKQTQKLAITLELRQSLLVLQMPVAELERYISQQLLENCMLEQEDLNTDTNFEETEFLEPLSLNDLEITETKDGEINYDEYLFSENLTDDTQQFEKDTFGKGYDNLNATAPSLQDHLISQLYLTPLNSKEKLLAEFLIGNIDEDGYLRSEVTELAKILKKPVSEVENILRLIQTFDPPGVGSRNLGECLQLQLNIQKEYLTQSKGLNKELLELMAIIIEDHLSDIAEARLNKVTVKVKRSISDVQAAIDLIKSLDPKPGRNFGNSSVNRFILPDVTLKMLGAENLIIINEPANARLSVNPLYRQLYQNSGSTDEKTLEFIKKMRHAALQIIKSIEQRKTTLYRITQSIFKTQNEFLLKGTMFLKPLTLHQIAEAVGIHESTVSRAIADKYIDTPRGIFPLKFFFSASITSESGAAVSNVSVKKQIATIINDENPKAPLNDQQITEILMSKGITISRRTISKYREELMIPAANKRRRY